MINKFTVTLFDREGHRGQAAIDLINIARQTKQLTAYGCKFSRFKSREIDDGNTALEMDFFSYMTYDTLEPPQTNNALARHLCCTTQWYEQKETQARSTPAHN